MLPTWRQRIVILLAALLGAAGWLAIGPAITPADGSAGVVVASARVGPAAATGLIALVGLPAVALGVGASVTGQMLSGVFAAAAGLGSLAWWGGSIEGWMRRGALPGDYAYLLAEIALWQAGVLLLVAAIQIGRAPLRGRVPRLATGEPPGLDADARFPEARALGAGALTAAIGGGLSWLLIQSSDTAQVMVSLFAAFAAGGLGAHLALPQSNPAIHLCAPAAVAVTGYGWILTRFGGKEALLAAHFADGLPGPALALPIHYASAGVAGCALGVGWAEGLRGGDA